MANNSRDKGCKKHQFRVTGSTLAASEIRSHNTQLASTQISMRYANRFFFGRFTIPCVCLAPYIALLWALLLALRPLQYATLQCVRIHCSTLHYSVLRYTAVCKARLQCVTQHYAVCYATLQCVTQHYAVCYATLQCAKFSSSYFKLNTTCKTLINCSLCNNLRIIIMT